MPAPTRTADRLPAEARHDVSRAAVAWTLVVTFALVAAANAAARILVDEPTFKHDERMIHAKWDLAREPGGHVDVLVVGDSSGNFAVACEPLESALSVDARNLCTYGRFTVLGATWMVEEHLRHNPAPELVVVVHGARTWILPTDGFALEQIPLGWGFWSRYEPGIALGSVELAELALARFVPLYASHVSFSQALRHGRWRIGASLPIEPHGDAIMPFANPAGVARFADRVRGEMDAFGDGPLPERNAAALRALGALADEHGFDVAVVHGPTWTELAADPRHAALVERVDALVREIASEHPRLHLLPRVQTFPGDVMENPYHLTRDAALEYTRTLAADLRDAGLGP